MQPDQELQEARDKGSEMNTLSMVLNKVIKNGYMETFTVTNRGMQPQSQDKWYAPDEIDVVNFYRFEGDTDPGDMAILYVIETADGLKGTLVDAYGTYSDGKVNDFMQQVESISKKVVKKDPDEALNDLSSQSNAA